MGHVKRMVVVGLGLAMVALTARCFDPDYPEGLACDGPTDCPPGQVCRGGSCTTTLACGQPEECNGVDDDCDGLVDESAPNDAGGCECIDGAAEACAIGACPADGTRTCAAGTWGECLGATAPSPELCDGVKDEDCDGTVDEPEECDCTNGMTRPCGPCLDARGMETCDLTGAWGACVGGRMPSPEQCDVALVDEDCDGTPNEECPCLNGQTRDCGTCGDGAQTCNLAGQWGACTGGTPPGVCCPGQLQPCGNCGDGLQSCTAAGQWGACTGATPTGPCCPGQTRSCGTNTGECSTGTEACTANGTWSGSCAGNVGPVAETCNGRDDDCDGSSDEIAACTACVPIGDVVAFPMGAPVVGDTEFGGHGPAVTIETSYSRSGAQVCAEVRVRMRETASNWSEAIKTVRKCATAAGNIAAITTPGTTYGYTDTDPNDFDGVPVQQGMGIGSIRCAGDTNGPDLCSDQAMPNCSGCEVRGVCPRVTYQ